MNTIKERTVDLSIVIPIYNSANIFPELYKQLVSALQDTVKSFELVAVLDGCKDPSFDVISKYCASDSRVKLIEFSRNFGHQAAITAGLSAATGGMVAIMDDDLEDPPEILPKFIAKIKEGFDVVYGIRKKRKRNLLHRFLFKSFYRIFGMLASMKIPYDSGDFCIMNSRIVKILNNMPESNRYLRGLRTWTGFKQTGIEYDRGERFANRSGYSFRKYIAIAFDAIFSFSYKPLRIVSAIGIFIALFSFLMSSRYIYLKLVGRLANVPGWTTLILSVLFLSGIQLISIGIIGEYIARIYDEAKNRPHFIIMRSIGISEEDDARIGK